MPRLEPKFYIISLSTALSKTRNFKKFVPHNKNKIRNKQVLTTKIALVRGHLWPERKRLVQQALKNETASGIIKVNTIIIKEVSRCSVL